jgi:hypothetical protein
MTTTEATPTCANATATTCPICNGTGIVGTWVQWSDGLGGASATCSLCDGAGSFDFDPATELARLKSLLEPFLYKVWLVAGCYPKSSRSGSEAGHVIGLRNEVLRELKKFPESLHQSCDIRRPEDK